MVRQRRTSTSITSNKPTFASSSTFPHKDGNMQLESDKFYGKFIYETQQVDIVLLFRESINATVGQYRPNINAIPLAIGKIEVKQPIYIVEDHTCIHLDISVQMIVFDCMPNNKPLTCKAVHITSNSVIGSVFDMISVQHIPGISGIKKGDSFDARFDQISNSGELCQIMVKPLLTRRLAENDDTEEE
ncbi:hypothetical protein DdX_07058 [Ditylenchus destructor]|uniref:Uncharacterized protein n=1 Tax=Ditylenchus destructor TaxID=166010 RepID=A0AAD4R8V6_9BILA|nr:hypothetical protein DdX_07058 [Ditylenchus destructor]